MPAALRLEDYLEGGIGRGAPLALQVQRTVLAVARAGCRVADLLASGPLTPGLAVHRGDSHGDTQKELDLRANGLMLDALRSSPVAVVASEELDEPLTLDPTAALAVAIDPLDGSSNIDTTAPVGTIFSILPAREGDAPAAFLRPGTEQVAAGFLIYGTQTALVLTQGDGTHLFTLDRGTGGFVCVSEPVRIASSAREYAINGSNHRHWHPSVRRYVDECVQGAAGPRGVDFNTRWIASMVAEAYRILVRGGVYLYPADARPSYREGRLRLTYEANPIAWLMEQAGAAATDGHRRILDLLPRSIHQRVPLVFGAADEVARIARYHSAPDAAPHEPLFGHRTLFRSEPETQGARA